MCRRPMSHRRPAGLTPYGSDHANGCLDRAVPGELPQRYQCPSGWVNALGVSGVSCQDSLQAVG